MSTSISNPSHVDVAFAAMGSTVPLDHGYALYGALSHRLPGLHEHEGWAVHPIRGVRSGPGVLALIQRGAGRSTVKLRLPVEALAQVLGLVGQSLVLHGHRMGLGAPVVYPLEPSERLRARFVTIHGFHGEPEPFHAALQRQLDAVAGLCQPPGSIGCTVGPRRVQRVKGKSVVGFAVALEGLTAQGSIAVQIAGLGGRRRMGSGVFVPPAKGA
jgi:CRISPR-associated protein Cas6